MHFLALIALSAIGLGFVSRRGRAAIGAFILLSLGLILVVGTLIGS